MKRQSLLLVFIGIISLAAGFIFSNLISSEDRSGRSTVSQTAAIDASYALTDIPLKDQQGNISKLGDWPQPVIVVNFWAPWCAPCRREIPALITLQTEFSGQLQILGIALDGADNVRRFEKEYAMNYPSILAGNDIPMYNAVFKNHSGSLPYTVVIDKDRHIQYSHNGEISLQEIRLKVSSLLE